MLHFNGIEPIDFRGKKCQPKMDAENKLRLQAFQFKANTEEERLKAADLLGACFDEKYAKDFIKEKLSWEDMQVLRTYLVSGETGLNNLSKATDGAIEKYVTRAMESMENGE